MKSTQGQVGSWGLGAIPELVGDTAILSRGPAERTHVGVKDTHNLRGKRQEVLMGPGNVPVGLSGQFLPTVSQKCPHPWQCCLNTMSRTLWDLDVTGRPESSRPA